MSVPRELLRVIDKNDRAVMRAPAASSLLNERVAEKFDVVDGMIAIPERPGRGLPVNRDFVERCTVC